MRPWLALLLLILALAPASAAAAGTRLRAPAGQVSAGDSFEVRWEGLPEDVREAELEMSLDGGRWVRISPELHSLEGSYHWVIPNTPAERVRLRLRCGGEHREGVVAVSGEFRILSGPLGAGRTDFLGEWWSALDAPGARTSPSGTLTPGAPFFSEHFERASAEAPVAVSLESPADDGFLMHSGAQSARTAPHRGERCSRPDFVPLRN